jgi:hypothetical protein
MCVAVANSGGLSLAKDDWLWMLFAERLQDVAQSLIERIP